MSLPKTLTTGAAGEQSKQTLSFYKNLNQRKRLKMMITLEPLCATTDVYGKGNKLFLR